MQEVAKVAGLVAVAAFLLWKVVRAHKRGCQKINEQQDASPQPIRTTAKPVKHDDDADGHTPDNTPLIGVPDVSPPQRPTLFMRIPSTRSLHSTCSMEHTDSIPDELPRLGTAQAPHPAEAPIQMPTAYSMSDSLPSSSQLGIKLGSRTLSSLFRDGSEGRVEQNYWSLDDDAMSSSGQSSVNSPCRNNDTGTARAGGGDGGVDAYGVHMVFPGTTVGGPPSLQATGVIASNPFVTDSPFFDEGGAMDGGATDGGDGGVKPVGVRTDSSTSGGVHSSGALGVKASASSQSSTTTGGALARGSGADRTAGGGGADNGSGGGGGGGQGPWRTLSGGSKRSRQVLEQPCLAIELHVTEGPCSGVRYHADDTTTQITIGRLDNNTLTIADQEVSGMHLKVEWDAENMAWKVADQGSLNGSLLNSYSISKAYRQPGDAYRLRNGDVLQLGSATKLTVTYAARDLLPLDMHAAPLVVPDKVLTTDASNSSGAGVLARSRSGVDGGGGDSEGVGGPTVGLRSGATLMQPKSAACLGELFTCGALGLEGAGCQVTGVEHARRHQCCEDVWMHMCPIPNAPIPTALVCVCDGHTGIAAAIQVRAHLPLQLQAALAAHEHTMRAGGSLEGMWKEVFAQVDDIVKTDEGCTGTVGLVWRSDGGDVCVQVANVGDSTALCIGLADDEASTNTPLAHHIQQHHDSTHSSNNIQKDTTTTQPHDATPSPSPHEPPHDNNTPPPHDNTRTYTEMTCAHRPNNPVERQRLAALGVQVGRHGRLYGLNLSRGFGDSCLKEQDLGMTAEPHVSPVVRVPRGGALMLLMASDGLWDVAPHERAVEVAVDAYHASFGNVRLVAQTLVEHAQKQRSKDDITVLALTVTQ